MPCAPLEFGLIPWARELLVELNDETVWGQTARRLLDEQRVPLMASSASPPHAARADAVASQLSRTHLGRLCTMLGGYGIFISS